MAVSYVDTIGQWGEGNIDLNHRKVVHNPDGSISTELSFSTEIDGQEVLLPTVINGEIYEEEDAIDYYFETGEYLGKFNSVSAAEDYAERLHERQQWYYGGQRTMFAGYLIRLGGSSGYDLPMKFMKPDSYVVEPNQRLESEAGRAVTGLLHRTTLAQTKTKIEFETPSITNYQVAELNTLLQTYMSDQHRKDITIQYYDMENDTYKVADCYIPDIKYTIHTIKQDDTIVYNSIRYAFIEY